MDNVKAHFVLTLVQLTEQLKRGLHSWKNFHLAMPRKSNPITHYRLEVGVYGVVTHGSFVRPFSVVVLLFEKSHRSNPSPPDCGNGSMILLSFHGFVEYLIEESTIF